MMTLFFILLALGVLLVLFGFPGTWLIVCASVGYAQVSDFGLPGQDYRVIALLIFLALLAEALEFLISIIGAKRMAVSTGAIVASFIGGIVGGIVASAIVPVIGSLFGLFAGAFCAAFAYEWVKGRQVEPALKVAFAVLISRVLAVFFKTAIALVMVGVIVWKLLTA